MIRMNSIVYKMASRLTIILVILFMILVTSNIYSLNVVQTNYYTSSQNTLNLYRVNIQNYLDNVSRDLLEVLESHADMSYNIENSDETGLYFKSLELKNALMSKMSHQSSSDVMFIKSKQFDFPIAYFGNRIHTSNKLQISDILETDNMTDTAQKYYGEWSHMKIDEQYYIYKTITYNNVTFGTIIGASTLFTILNHNQKDHVSYYIEHIDQTILASLHSQLTEQPVNMDDIYSSQNENYLVTKEAIESLGTLVAVVEKQHIFYGLQFAQWFIVALAIIAIIVVPLVIRSLSQAIIKPILELSKAAKEVEKGGGQFKSFSQNYSLEFMKLFHAFQSMVIEIGVLKIHAYEEELSKKRIQLDYLLLQIRPHFYLNAISTISSLTYQNKNEEIRAFIVHLSHYLRYKFNRALHLVSIHDELNQVSNYLKMQETRYPNQVLYILDLQSNIDHNKIPNFIIQSFVENSFKHAMFFEEILTLFIKIELVKRDNQHYIYILIEDNGEGYSRNYLNSYITESTNQTNHIIENSQIGIQNIKKTLELLYKRNDLLYLSNHEQMGAKVEIWIPMNDEAIEERE